MGLYDLYKLVVNGVILVCSVLHILTFVFVPPLSFQFHRLALMASMASYGASFVITNRARSTGPSLFSLDGIKEMLKSPDAQYFLMTLTFFVSGYMNFLILAPICIFATYAFLQAGEVVLGRNSWIVRTLGAQLWGRDRINTAIYYAAALEACLGLMLIIGIFLRQNGLLLAAMYWNFLGSRYRTSQQMRTIFSELRKRLDTVFNSKFCPGLLRAGWQRVVAFLSNYAARS